MPPHSEKGALDIRYALIDRRGRVVRAWRILSKTQISPGSYHFIPELVGGDPVVDLEVGYRERVVLRLGPHGTKARFSLSNSIYGEGTLYADLRIGPDGRLYQLTTSHETGIAVIRYSLG